MCRQYVLDCLANIRQYFESLAKSVTSAELRVMRKEGKATT